MRVRGLIGQTRNAGAEGFIRKPFRRQELLEVIAETIGATTTYAAPARMAIAVR